MKRYTRLVSSCLVILCLMPVAAYAQGQATVLTPITPPDIEPVNKAPLIMANDQGHVLVVYHGKRAKTSGLHSAYSTGGSWQPGEVPLPAGIAKWRSLDLYNLAWHGNRFALLLRNRGKYYYALWSGNSWSAPALIPDDAIEHPRRVNFDASGNLIFWDPGGGKGVTRLVGGQYQSVVLPMRLKYFHDACNELVRGRTGALHIAAASARMVPTVASLAADSDLLQAANWVMQPPENDANTAPTREMKQSRQIALDWPRQTVWASWERKYKMFVSHAPLGATNNAQWVTWEVPLGEKWKTIEHRFTASTGGAVGVVYLASDGHGRQLLFRWLPPNGLGQELQLVRPGSQTEAADFSQLHAGTLGVVAAPDGVAHVVIKGTKRGEYPENTARLYYSRVTGGAVLAQEPGVTGGGQQVDATVDQTGTGGPDWRQQGGKPDLSPVITMKAKPIMRNGQPVYRYGYHSRTVSFDVGIHNGASQYFGDVEADILVDGAVVHYRKVDETKHMRAMIQRDATLVVYGLPGFKYESSPIDGWQAPELSTTDKGRGLPNTVRMGTGLGRKLITVIVDPQNKIEEENEDNNVVEMAFEMSDGRDDADVLRLTDDRGRTVRCGHNDLAILGTPQLYANTKIAAPGLMQRPTTARMIVGNPRGANFFRNVEVVALLDGTEVWRHTIDLMDDTRHLYNRDTQWFGHTAPARRGGPEVMGGFLDVPVDLTNAAVGNHTLILIVDPEDHFADLQPDNNSASLQFRVREPGGTLRVSVRDRDTNAAVARAHMDLPGLYFAMADASGQHSVVDMPAGNYDARDLWASRPYPDPRYGRQPAGAGFTVTKGQVTDVTVLLEAPVRVIVTVLDQQTGEPLPETANASLKYVGESSHRGRSGDGYLTPYRQGNKVHFIDVPPGSCEITATGYAYQAQTITADVHRDANGECHVQVSLPRMPRGQVMGRVVDADDKPVTDAGVWLNGAPRWTGTDNAGHFTLSEVEAGRNYQVVARRKGYFADRVTSGVVQAGGIRTVLLHMTKLIPRLSSKLKSLSVNCVAWAQIESWPGFSFGSASSESYDVSAEHGKFTATMAMFYREIQGEDNVMVDSIVLGTKGGPFWSTNITYSYSLSSVISTGIGMVSGKDIARLVSLVAPINDTFDFINGDTDPSQMQDGEVAGSFSSQTGADYRSVALIPMPSVEFSPGMHGGQTVVRTDILEVSDGLTTKRVRRQWYSPQTAVYNIGEKMALDQLEVRFYVAVLNDRLSPGPLYASSKNVMTWRPMENNWLRFEPSNYDPIGAH